MLYEPTNVTRKADSVIVLQQDREVHVMVVVMHTGEGQDLPLFQLVHFALHDPPEDLLVMLGQALDPLVVHLRYSRSPASQRFLSAARFCMSFSNSSSPSLGVSSTIGRVRNAGCVTIRRNPGSPIFPSPMWKWRSTRLPRSVFESFRCHIRTSGEIPWRGGSPRGPLPPL